MAAESTDHLNLWKLGPQQLAGLDLDTGDIVADAGLLAVRAPWNDPYVSSLTLLPLLPDRGLLCTSVTRSKPS